MDIALFLMLPQAIDCVFADDTDPVSTSSVGERQGYGWGVCKIATLMSRVTEHTTLPYLWSKKNKPTVITRPSHQTDLSILSAEAKYTSLALLASFAPNLPCIVICFGL